MRPDDRTTSTLDGATARAALTAEPEPPAWDAYGGEDDEERDPCGCADPGCPCEGVKRGGSP